MFSCLVKKKSLGIDFFYSNSNSSSVKSTLVKFFYEIKGKGSSVECRRLSCKPEIEKKDD